MSDWHCESLTLKSLRQSLHRHRRQFDGLLTAGGAAEQGDLAFGAVATLLLRLHVLPDLTPKRPLLTVRLRGNTLDHMTTVAQSWPMILDNLWSDELAALPGHEVVAASLLEHEYGEAASKARAMIRRGKAFEALEMLCGMDAAFSGHPWLEQALAHLKDVARHTSYETVQDSVAMESPSPIAARREPNDSGAPE